MTFDALARKDTETIYFEVVVRDRYSKTKQSQSDDVHRISRLRRVVQFLGDGDFRVVFVTPPETSEISLEYLYYLANRRN